MCYYGVVEPVTLKPALSTGRVRILLGGTVSPQTGAPLLVGAMEILRCTYPERAAGMEIVITGKGSSMEEFRRLEESSVAPRVIVYGRLNDAGYARILSECQVGLALKLAAGPLADTTFPSKIIELANAGLLVVSTDISDVRKIFGDGALFLVPETAQVLAELLLWAMENPRRVAITSELGRFNVGKYCDPVTAGYAVAQFLFGEL